MPPNSSGSTPLLLNTPMRRGGPGGPPQPVAGGSAPLGVSRSEFEDFMNAYRPTGLDAPFREPPPPPPPRAPPDDSKLDFRKSIKKLMKRPQASPSVPTKNHRKEGVQRTPTVISGYSDGGHDAQRPQPRAKRPASVNIDATLCPPTPTFGQSPVAPAPDAGPLKSDAGHPATPTPSPTSKTPKTAFPTPVSSKSPKQSVVVQPPQQGLSKAGKSQSSQSVAAPPQQAKTPKPSVVQAAKSPKTSTAGQNPVPKPPTRHKAAKNGVDEGGAALRTVPENVPSPVSDPVPANHPQQVKGESLQAEKQRRTGNDGFSDDHCLIITGNNIGRFLPPHHNPDPILSMKVVPVQDRKYFVVMEFEESPEPPKRVMSASGMLVFPPEPATDSREQRGFFSWIREAHVTPIGMLLRNVERITEFPHLTYLVVGGTRQEMVQKLNFVSSRPNDGRGRLRFLAGYEEPVTICRPPLTTFPEKPASDKTGYIVCLYQVLEFEDSLRFEQNWVMWTGARMIYRTLPGYMGLRRISVHKSVLPARTINYVLLCEFSNIMDHLTEACVIVDHLRARCCGFIGIYRVLDCL